MIDPPQRTLGDLLDSLADGQATYLGLTFAADDGAVSSLTYAELADASLRAAAGFARLGVEPGDRVVVQLANRPEAVLAWFGLARLGAIFVPANPADVRELEHVVSTLGREPGVGRRARRSPRRGCVRAGRRPAGGRAARGSSRRSAPRIGRARLHLRDHVRAQGRRDHARELRLPARKAAAMELTADDRLLGAADLPRQRAVGPGRAHRGRAVRADRAVFASRYCEQPAAHGRR